MIRGKMIRLDHFFKLVETFGAATGLAEATISTRVFNDGDRIKTLRNGGDLGVRKMERALDWFSAHWPEGAAWPEDIPRPVDAPPAEVPA